MSVRMFLSCMCLGALVVCCSGPTYSADAETVGLYARKNLIAWCIVPFDSKKRGPEERAAMLEKLGFTKFAYDYRAEHIPTFDAEIEALKRHHVELSAWWFPTALNDEAKMTLATFAKHKVTPQLWVTGGGGPTRDEADQRARVVAEAARIRPIAEAAAKVGCKVALYNHGGWFGEPENQIAVIQELKLDNVGIVYNLHHGHDHLDRFAELLKTMKPHLYALNLNGMVKEGDRKGQKILQLSQGDLDLRLLQVIRDSGYTGPIGILGHTQDDAEERLHDNLDGLDWLLPQLKGQPAGPKPKMRTPVPQAAAAVPAVPASNVPLVDGKFGKALDGRAGGAFIAGREEFRKFPITVEAWTRLTDKSGYNILVAHELKSSGTHWEIFSMAGNGNFTAYIPGFAPDHCYSNAMICDGQWHHVAMVLAPDRILLFVDGKQVADQAHKRSDRPTEQGGLAIGSLIDRAIGSSGLVDEVRISQGDRAITAAPDKPFTSDASTIALWHLDELIEQKQFDDASGKKNTAILNDLTRARPAAPVPAKGVSKSGKIEGHWGEDAIGFRWTEADSRDDRLGKIESGPFFSGSITGPGGPVYKAIVVRIGDKKEASICYDTELLRVAAGWTGFLKFDPARFGVIVPPRIDGPALFSTQRFPGISHQEQFANFREANPYGPLPKDVAHYEGLYRHKDRVVLKYAVGAAQPGQDRTTVLESPWLETTADIPVVTRTLRVSPSTTPFRLMVAESSARVRLHPGSQSATLVEQPGIGHVLVVAPHDKPITIKLLLAAADTNAMAFDTCVAASPAPENVVALTEPGPPLWGEPLVTKGEIAAANPGTPYVVDTVTLPFENRFNALFFCGGHDFFRDGRAAVCTLHGDVWLVDGLDSTLNRVTWRRFATGLFQPLGLKIVRDEVYVVGRDQITRLRDTNGDGEADVYDNFNNDAHVTLNGHEYVTCLETDRAGNFYYIKGNCNSQTPHDGSLLRVSADGSRLDVHATGFRNSNGIGMGPQDQITVAPQEGEWTPASAVFVVREGGFYGGMMSHHRPVPPTDFERPLAWFPRLADNSSGGQVWTTGDRWGPLSNQLFHMSYGQCRLRLMLTDDSSSPDAPRNGGSLELPLRFNSGIHRGRMNPHDGQLYVTGLKGWTTSAVHDGCFQRVRYTGQPAESIIGLKTYANGVALRFTRDLDRDAAEDPANYQMEGWNYLWSASYGSPEYRPSAPGQVGRDSFEAKSATLLPDGRTVFLELPELRPIDQLVINGTLLTADRRDLEQSVVLTLNSIPKLAFPERELHRRTEDQDRLRLLASLKPGLQLREATVDRHVRQFAWMVPADEVTTVGQPANRKISGSGWIKIPSTGRYRFSANASPSTILFRIAGAAPVELTAEGIEVSLSRGTHPIAVEQSGSAKGDVQFRLMWESRKFPREAIPASALVSNPIESAVASRERGAFLLDRLRCANCHKQPEQVGDREFAEALRAAPRLDGVGSRLQPAWIAQWIRQPAALRNHTTMPAVLNADDLQTANDISAWLGTLTEPLPPRSDELNETTAVADQHRQGAELFERLGCIACHTFAPPDRVDEWNRTSLHFVAAKFQPQALAQFLREPHGHYPQSRMPDFRLNAAEVSALASYLQRESKGRLEATAQSPQGNPERGKLAFQKLRCGQCHVTSKSGSLTAPDAASIASAAGQRDDASCLAKSPVASRSPRFQLSDLDRSALTEYLATPKPAAAVSYPVNVMIAELRCNACHARDLQASKWPEIVVEDGSGKLPDPVPHLTWVGEKLQGDWVEKFVKGDVAQRPRPWLTARMPSFPAYASSLAHAMAAEHGVPFSEPLPLRLDSAKVEIGRQLTGREGGLDCRQCHGVGKQQPRGDESTQIALGINFVLTKDRLRPEFAMRQLFDPPRYDSGSRMPRFAPDLQTTAARQIENGNARKQFEALAEYLWSVTPD